MKKLRLESLLLVVAGGLATTLPTAMAHAVSSAEMYTADSYTYGRFVARIQFPAGDGVVGSFFLWKDGSEKTGTFWNELDIEKIEAECLLETNAFFGNPAEVHHGKVKQTLDFCNGFHTYAYEWTPEYIAWSVDGNEIRRETGDTAKAYADNAADGMQLRFNIWPGDASFGGTFRPSILPVYEYVNWVEYYSYADGSFKLEWREDFDGGKLPSGWATGSWGSPKGLSTHATENVSFVDGYAVLSLTADDALGSGKAKPNDSDSSGKQPEPSAAGGTSSTSASTNSSAVGGASRVQESTANGSARGGSAASSETTGSSAGGTTASSQTSKATTTTTAAAPGDDSGGCALLRKPRSTPASGIAAMMAAGLLLAFARRSRSRQTSHSGKETQS